EVIFTNAWDEFNFSADESKFGFLESNHTNIQIFDLANRKIWRRIQAPLFGNGLAFSPDGRLLAAGVVDAVQIWELPSGSRKHLIPSGGGLFGVAFSADSKTLATYTYDNVAALWHVATGREMLRFENFNPGGHRVYFSPDGTYFAITGKASK